MQIEHTAFITPDEVAKALRVSRPTVYRLIESGEVPARRIGGQWRIPVDWLNEQFTVEASS